MLDYGALGDGEFLITHAFADAVDACEVTDPPVTSVSAPVRVLQSASDPPQGTIFCGSPRSSSIVHDAGTINWGKAGTSPNANAIIILNTLFLNLGYLIC